MEALVPASMEIASPWSARSTALFIWEADTVPPLTPALPEELEAAVEDYRVLLYNHVFDKKNRVEGFFTLTE